ncbi:protein arginine N-methyltransferase 7-like isoform X2 [Chenopodium quinoa]|uniref:protein arginine N-methyltransferase 7-like isoform X2 n=1 Tax=Chenopodium quinoa TaxID=63459 RepID=UPI000B784728|nr:protein arginine N-methyltransferase 7-like isoform X2 [Chenopodium quinoa]
MVCPGKYMSSTIALMNSKLELISVPELIYLWVSEILDSELLGEGLIPTLQNAHDELLVENPDTVPYRAVTYGQLVESSFLWRLHDLYSNEICASDGIRLVPTERSSILSIEPQQYPMHCDPLQEELKLLSEPFKIFEFDFWKRPSSHGEAEILVEAATSGSVNAVLSWWVLQLDKEGTVFYSTAPKWIKLLQTEFPGNENWCDHWKQCVWFVPGKGLSVSKGENIQLLAVHSDISISYSLWAESQRNKKEHVIRKDDFQLTLSPEKIATYSDDKWRRYVSLALQNALHRKDSPLCFVLDDSIFLATAIAHLCKTSRVMLLFPGLRERGLQYLRATAETNQFSADRLKLLDHRLEYISIHETDGKKIDLLVGEPFYYGSETWLPWKNLRFWKERTRLEGILSKDAIVIPCKGILRVCAMSLPDLWKSRCSLTYIEGFNHSVANTILGACGNLPSPQEGPILPFFVWQSGESKELSERLTLMEFDFSKPMSSCSGKAKVKFTGTGICHGFVLWIDWVLSAENDSVVSTGPDHRQWKQGVKLLKTPVAVSSQDHMSSDDFHSVEMEANFDSANGDLMIQYVFV